MKDRALIYLSLIVSIAALSYAALANLSRSGTPSGVLCN